MRSKRSARTPWRAWLIAWLGAAVLGVANGVARGALYERQVGSPRAHYLSTAVLLALLSAYMRVLSRAWPLTSLRDALLIGSAWTALTVGFEFGLGRLVAHESWSALFEQYNIARGKVWMLIPAWIAIGPAVLRQRPS
jgi:hypothetical protein